MACYGSALPLPLPVLFVLFTDIVKVTKQRELHWAVYVARTGEIGNTSEVVVGELEGKRPWDT